MDIEAFKRAYGASRNGTDAFHFNPLYRNFLYSDGVKECAEAGCYWLLDILGAELPGEFLKAQEDSCAVIVKVAGGKAVIGVQFDDDVPSPYRKVIDWTDMPNGEWVFYVSKESHSFRCILMTEYWDGKRKICGRDHAAVRALR